MANKRISHDWTGQLGGVFKCSVCRTTLTDKTLNSGCQGTRHRSDNEHVSFGEPLRNIGQIMQALSPETVKALKNAA